METLEDLMGSIEEGANALDSGFVRGNYLSTICFIPLDIGEYC